jgi:hypothetical protein
MGAGVRLEFGAESGLSGTGRAEGAVRALVDGKGRVPVGSSLTEPLAWQLEREM